MLIKKFYEYIKDIITENYLYFLFLLVCVATFTYPLPYYIYNGGGLINVSDKIDFSGKTKSDGSYNLCYVSEIRATIPSFLYSFIKPDWEKVKIKDVTLNTKENHEDIYARDKIYLETANTSALITAFNFADKDIEIISSHPVVISVLETANNDFKIGDEVVSIENYAINSIDDISKAIDKYKVGDKVTIKVINNGNQYERYAYIIEEDGNKLVGISIENKLAIKTNPAVNFKFDSSESGPSGGLILSLALYDYLVEQDVTHGLKISGTGTIDNNGKVGEIGGVKYKLAGAVKSKADVFFVPNGENYNEAIKLKKEKKYKIDIVGVSTFKDAIDYLNNM